jgi:hypothetical protein
MSFSSSSTPQAQEKASARLALAACTAVWQIRDVRVPCQHLSNVFLCLDSSDHDQAITTLRDGLADGVGGLGLTLSADDVRLPLLLCLLDYEPRTLRLLLCNLLLLDGLGEFLSERHVRDGHIFERNVELASALEEIVPDAVGDGFSLGDELGGIELGNDGFEDFVSDRGEHALVVVQTEVLGPISNCMLHAQPSSNCLVADISG